jgi:hypothetical protein
MSAFPFEIHAFSYKFFKLFLFSLSEIQDRREETGQGHALPIFPVQFIPWSKYVQYI